MHLGDRHNALGVRMSRRQSKHLGTSRLNERIWEWPHGRRAGRLEPANRLGELKGVVRLFIEMEQASLRSCSLRIETVKWRNAARKTLPLTDLRDDRAHLSVDDVRLANNDVPVVEGALRERLAGRVRPQVTREAGRLEDRQVPLDDEQRGSRRCSSEIFPRRLMTL